MTKFSGLIQHSFALRMGEAHHPFVSSFMRECIAERFELRTAAADFRVKTLHDDPNGDCDGHAASHSPLVRAGMTTVRSRSLRLLDRGAKGSDGTDGNWPAALEWAKGEQAKSDCHTAARPRMRFAEFDQRYERVFENDFLIEEIGSDSTDSQRGRVARALLESIGFRRSQLFGLAVANRFVNVMLPSASLEHRVGKGFEGSGVGAGHRDLILQPLLSLTRDGSERRIFRKTYSLTFFVIGVERDTWRQRDMFSPEIESVVNAGWSLADSVPQEQVPRYAMRGPLNAYVTDLSQPEVGTLLEAAEHEKTLSLRQVIEIASFGIALRMAQGSSGEALSATKRRISDDVVTSLGTARVSAVVLVDSELEVGEIEAPIKKRDPPGSLGGLMSTLACETRPPSPWTSKTRRQYTLDRPFVDGHDYAVGVIPRNRCLVVTNVAGGKKNSEPLLSQVAAVTYMTIGAATAIGTMRTIGRELERVERKDPGMIAEIDGEIATDLNEIYDLDITRESYRHLYRRLRGQLGISTDYKTLQGKMEALYRETSTIHDEREQKQLAVLTAAIVILSVLILIGTIVIAAKPGGG